MKAFNDARGFVENTDGEDESDGSDEEPAALASLRGGTGGGAAAAAGRGSRKGSDVHSEASRLRRELQQLRTKLAFAEQAQQRELATQAQREPAGGAGGASDPTTPAVAAAPAVARHDAQVLAQPQPEEQPRQQKKTRRLIGGGSGAAVAMRVAPSWDLVHTNFMRVLDAEQRALLLGKPMIKPNVVPTVRWDLKLERRDFINSLLTAFVVATKKKLLCGATFHSFPTVFRLLFH